ncbi:MAG: VanZ family protein [Lachnospiraceae bacterium]|nr:VanZ family protein [Lachnospiraceae bacterium]
MESEKRTKILLNIAVVFISVIGLMLLLYMVMVLSFENGDESISKTRSIASIIAQRVYSGTPTEGEINAVIFMLRYFAHIVLFFVVGLVTTFVSMVIFRNYFRILGVLASGGACYVLAYYTEYYKQYVEGRHFQMTDVKLNWLGSIAGIACMVISYLMNKLLMKLSS